MRIVYNYTMNKKHVTTKIWKGTLIKIRIAAALFGKSNIQIIEDMVNFWLTENNCDPMTGLPMRTQQSGDNDV